MSAHSLRRLALLVFLPACVGGIEPMGAGDDPTAPGEVAPAVRPPGGGPPPAPGPAASAPTGNAVNPERLTACGPQDRGATAGRLWRLTAVQYENTLASLVPDGALGITNPFSGADSGQAFNNHAAT